MAFKPLSKLFMILTIGALALSACGPEAAEATPTPVSAEAVFTAAAGTVMAQLTGTAAVQSTATMTPSPTVTGTATATLATIATNAQSAAVVPPSSGNTGGGAVGCNNSAFVSDVTVPDNQQIAPGAVFTKTWRLQNNGTCAWNTNYKLTVVSGEAMGGVTTTISQTVNAGSTADVSVTLTAPATPKTYVGYWKLSTDTGQAFGMSFYVQIVVAGTPATLGTPGTGLPTITPTFGASGCYNAALVSTNLTDGATIKAGATFRKTWVIKNTGTCDWTESFRLPYIGGVLMRDDTTNKLFKTIKPGSSLEYSLDFIAPTAPGTYTSTYRLMTDSSALFGPGFTVKIVVAGATFTPSATASITPSPLPATVTPTGTATVTPIATSITPSYP